MADMFSFDLAFLNPFRCCDVKQNNLQNWAQIYKEFSLWQTYLKKYFFCYELQATGRFLLLLP